MYANIFLSVGLVLAGMLFVSVSYKSYQDIQEAKQIQENYEIISQIKALLAKQYDKSTKEITRDEIIAHLPSGEYWEKVLLVSRDGSATLQNSEFINEDGNMTISTEEKIKLLSLRNKLRRIQDLSEYTEDNDHKITYDVWAEVQTDANKDNIINNTVTKAIEILYVNIDNASFASDFVDVLEDYTPYDAIYQNLLLSENEEITEDELKKRKQTYFKEKMLQKLSSSKNTQYMQVYDAVKDL